MAASRETALIIHPLVAGRPDADRTRDSQIDEARGLARAINLDVVAVHTPKVLRINPATLIGKGQCEIIAQDVEALHPSVIVVNHALSPAQQRNLERALHTKVIDRTGLILEIFGARAQSREGRLQVELASLEYQRSRLVRLWTHLERQRGGGGFMGGPGETQKELDRRMIRDRIVRVKRELEDVRRMRALGRAGRARVPLPVVALVGYTNAGKSTLFNALTGAGVRAEDLLFATLDPTTRRINLPGGMAAALSDTVGFISELPTQLVAAFRATLEQIHEADAIVHVIDIASEDADAQRRDVIEILADLDITYEGNRQIVEVWNKIDLLPADEQRRVLSRAKSHGAAAISAAGGAGLEALRGLLAGRLSPESQNWRFKISIDDGKALARLYKIGRVLKRRDYMKSITVDVAMEPRHAQGFTDEFGYEGEVIKLSS